MDGGRLLSVACSNRKNKGQWAGTRTQKIPYEHKDKLIYVSDRALEGLPSEVVEFAHVLLV